MKQDVHLKQRHFAFHLNKDHTHYPYFFSFVLGERRTDGTPFFCFFVFSVRWGWNKDITSVEFGNSLAYIGKYAFGSDYSSSGGVLAELSFSASLRLIDDYAFSYQTKIATVHFEEGLEYIGDSAFRNCNSVEYMIIPASVKTICRSGLQISQNGKLFLRDAFKDIDTENEWNGYAFRDLKPVPYYEYSETQKSGYWHFNSDELLCFYLF